MILRDWIIRSCLHHLMVQGMSTILGNQLSIVQPSEWHQNLDVCNVSIDSIIPAATPEGCSDPKPHIHVHNLHPTYDSVEKSFEHSFTVGITHTTCNQEQLETGAASLERGTLVGAQFDSTNTPTRDTSNNGDLSGISMIAATHDDSGYHIRARPQIDRFVNVPTRYKSPFKCITPRPPIDMIKAQVVRSKICTELKDKRHFVIWGPSQCLRCKEVAESFADGAAMFKSFMSFFVDCIRAEEHIYRPKCVGFRVFLSGYLGEMLNHDEEQQQCMYPDLAVFIKLQADIGDLDIFKVKLFFVPIPENNYYTLYCLNMVDKRIDILDSSNEDHEDYHTVVGDRVVTRLNELLQKLTDGKFKDFSRWKRPITRVMRENVPNDSPFIAMKVMEIWDGNKLHSNENQINMSELRSKMLYYMLYNTINQVKKLPYGLEEYKPSQ